jgi:hypothetical protein
MKAFRYKRPSGPTQDRAPRNVPPNYWDQQAQWWENALRSEMAPPASNPAVRWRTWTRWAWTPAAAALAIWGWFRWNPPSSEAPVCATFECQLEGLNQEQEAPQWVLQEVLNDPELSDQIILESLP